MIDPSECLIFCYKRCLLYVYSFATKVVLPVYEQWFYETDSNPNFCPGSGSKEVAAVICVDVQADLAVDTYALMTSVYLEDKYLYFLQVSIDKKFTIGWILRIITNFVYKSKKNRKTSNY